MWERLARHATGLAAVALFGVFFAYYLWTSSVLPPGAGPDYGASNDVTRFIMTEGRLPVLPRDEARLRFTPHGGTRALRPPLGYLVSAAVARAFPRDGYREAFLAMRKGSALLGALTVAVVYLLVAGLFGSAAGGVLAAAALGLLPQFSFIASYNNDDAAALFSSALLLYALSRVHRRGLDLGRALLLGLAAGLVVLSKFTAWLLLPFAALYAAWRLPWRSRRGWGLLGVMLAAAVAGGGWWVVFNMVHYGPRDPLAQHIGRVMSEKHRRLPPDETYGYKARGIGFYELWLKNHDNFIVETYKSTVGNLDWLRLKLGPFQYGLYLLVVILALGYYLHRLAVYLSRLRRGAWRDRAFLWDSLLLAVLLFQLYMYTWTNIQNDIQVQGRYLLPAFPALLLLAGGGLRALWRAAGRRWAVGDRFCIRRQGLAWWGLGGMAAFFLAAHLHAWAVYVKPFYDPPLYQVGLRPFQAIPAGAWKVDERHNVRVQRRDGALVLRGTGPDPWVVWGAGLCKWLQGNALLRFTLVAPRRGMLQWFVDEGEGFSEKRSYRYTYEAGEQAVIMPIAARPCRRLRLDPAAGAGRVELRHVEIAALGIRPLP